MLVEAVLCVVALLLLQLWNNRPSTLPPGLHRRHVCKRPHPPPPPHAGPRRYPIIGTGFGNNDSVKALQRKYGDVFSTRIGAVPNVFLCSYKLFKESFTKTEFADRPDWKVFHVLSNGEEAGVIFSSGERWQASRRFLLRQLRDQGMGKSSMDDAIAVEAKALVEDFHRIAGSPAKLPDSMNLVTLNIVWQLVASRRYSLDDEEMLHFLRLIMVFQEDVLFLVLPEFFPWLNYIPAPLIRKLSKKDWLQKMAKEANDMMQKVIDEHRATLDPSSPRDVIDSYLLEMERQKESPNVIFNDTDLRKNIFDLFAAGFDTTSNMMRYVCLYMAAHQDVQRKVQRQIDEVVPPDEIPASRHRARLPYLDAALQEVHRMASLVPLGVSHATATDVHLGDYVIPKGTAVAACIGLCHKDPRYWDQPEEFRPERFLDEEGKFVAQREGFLPFGIGRRSCLGEALARMELFSFTAALLQSFTFAPLEGCKVDLTYTMLPGINLPKEQELLIMPRT
ncbi:cytochrome P450 2L1-like [Penaeus chinensis]|uniref:cytochrome P450 2L1-like n=1 Tax=Penaeus chinensis TaxID=139456 RepID=UPI001FB65D7D|nr:cytochrome P450 2L1-like [Penaeus chinensis]